MKLTTKLISFLLTISSIFLLSACGVPTSKTTLKVTNSMAIGNNTYKGGLVFYGRSAGGKFFSMPVPYTAGASNNTAEVEIDKGIWTFAAVGWEHTNATPDPFQGKSKCAITQVNLDSDEKTVVLDLEYSNCSHTEFGGNFDATNLQFKLTNIVTCGSFYTNTTNATPLPLTAANNNIDYCSTNTNISPDLKIWAGSAKIRIPAIRQGLPPLPNSPLDYCVQLDQGRSTTTPSFRLPAKGVPVIIELFDSNNCTTDKSAVFELREGLNFNYSTFDHKYFTNTPPSISALYFLTTISKRGTSSLMASVPEFGCGGGTTTGGTTTGGTTTGGTTTGGTTTGGTTTGGTTTGGTTGGTSYQPCVLIPTPTYGVAGIKDRVVSNYRPIYVDDISNNKSCSKLSSFQNSGGTAINYVSSSPDYKCEEKNNKILFTFKGTTLSSAPISCSSTCTMKFNFNSGPSTTLKFEIQSNNQPLLAAYNQIFGLIGHEDIVTSPPSSGSDLDDGINSLQSFFESDDGENRHFGVLSQVRELFQPGTIGGLFNQYNTSATISGKSANVAFWDEGVLKSFRIDVESDNMEVPSYLKDDNSPYPFSGGDHSAFTNRITVSKILGGAFYPETIIRWKHGKKVGSLESKEIKTKNGETTLQRSLIFWNTEIVDHARFEVYNYEKKTTSSSPYTLLSQKTSFSRAERESTPGEGNARLESFSYDSSKDNSNSNYYQSARKSGTFLKDTRAIYVNSNLETTKLSGDADFFTRPELAPFAHSRSLTPKTSSALSPNGNHFVSSWAEKVGQDWVIKILRRFSNGRVIESFTTSAIIQPEAKVSINNNGHATVAFVVKSLDLLLNPEYKLYTLAWNGQTWIDYNYNFITQNDLVTMGVFTSINGILVTTNNIAFDLIDANPSLSGDPAPSSSDKHLIYSEFDGTNWNLKKITFTSGAWGNSSTVTTSALTSQPSYISVTKNSSEYHISLIMNNSGFKIQTMKTTNFGTPSLSSLVSIGIEAGSNPSALFSKYNTVSEKTDIIISSDSNKIYRTEFTPGTPSLGTISTNINSKFNEVFPYCFNRIRSGSIRPTHNAGPQNSGCNLPDSSYAPAIRSTVLIDHDNDNTTDDIDAGFKHDIQSLNPETFKYIFTMP